MPVSIELGKNVNRGKFTIQYASEGMGLGAFVFPILVSTLGEIKSIFIPNRTLLILFGGISGEFGGAMVRILARPNELVSSN